MWLSVLPLSPSASSFTQMHRINQWVYGRVALLWGWGCFWPYSVASGLGGGCQSPPGQGLSNFVVLIPVPARIMNRMLPGEPQASLPIHQVAASGSTGGPALLPPVSSQGGKRDFAPFRSTGKPPGSLPFTDCPLTSPFKSQREGHRVTWLIRTSPSCNPTCNTSYLWLIPGTLIQHSYTTLAGSWAVSRERSLVLTRGEGCWQTRGQVGSCPGPGMQQGASEGAERDSRAHRFCNGVQGKAPAQSDRAPWDAGPSRSALAQVMALLFFLGATMAWGWWIMGRVIWTFCSGNSLRKSCSHF